MKRVRLLAAALFIAAVSIGNALAQQDHSEPRYAVGAVFHDANHNGVHDNGEKGLEAVRVSNGRISVKTDSSGKYKIPVSDDTTIFVIKPRNWQTPVDANNVPRFYYIHKPNGSPKLKYKGVDPTGPLPAAVDFPLYPHPEPDRFRTVFLGDSQVSSSEEITYFAHDIVEELAGIDAAFTVSLGDIVNNDVSLYDQLVPVMGRIGTTCYYVKGDHDTNYDAAPDQKLVDETYERAFGPSHYSFDYGPVHFVALNNPYFAITKSYEARLDSEQMAFLRDDLASISKDQLVVLMMHIPISEMNDRKQIFDLLKAHPNVFCIAAHWHVQCHCFLTQGDDWNGPKPLHLLINVTSCGSWWAGSPDEVGLPHTTMRDGAPNGYSVITFSGTGYSIRYKAARRPEDYQMNIYAPDTVDAGKAGDTQVLANIFAGSERSKVEMRLGEKDAWAPMERVQVVDPAYERTKKLEDSLNPRPGAELPDLATSRHIWKANLPNGASAGTHLIQVRTTDMFGQAYTGSRVINVR